MSDNAASDPAKPATLAAADGVLRREVEIINKKGLHARASAKFVQMAEQYQAEISVTRGSETVGGTSIMGLMMLAAGPGTKITVQTAGKDAAVALEALCGLIARRFGEDD